MKQLTTPVTNKYDWNKLKQFRITSEYLRGYTENLTGLSYPINDGEAEFVVSTTLDSTNVRDIDRKPVIIFFFDKKTKAIQAQQLEVYKLYITNGVFDLERSIGSAASWAFKQNFSNNSNAFFPVACLNPFDNNSNVLLYNIIVRRTCEPLCLTIKNIPAQALGSQNSTSDTAAIASMVSNGSFLNSTLTLPSKYFSSEKYILNNNQVRDLVTPITGNISYVWISSKDFYTHEKINDYLSIEQFTVFDQNYYNLESNPENFLRIIGDVKDANFLPDYRSLTIKLLGATAIRNQTLCLSFVAANLDANLLENIPLEFWWSEIVDGVSTTGQFAGTVTVSDSDFLKYTVFLKQPDQGETQIQKTPNQSTEIQIRLPIDEKFNIGITNLILAYGTQELSFVRPPAIVNNVTNSKILGEIVTTIDSQDTRETLLADGRNIYIDDVHEFATTDKDEYFTSFVTSIPLTNIFNKIIGSGYPHGRGDNSAQCDSLHNPEWEKDAIDSGIDNVLYWNYQGFQPKFQHNIPDTVIKIVERHRSQDLLSGLEHRVFFAKNNHNAIYFGTETSNWIDEFVKKGGDDFYYSLAITRMRSSRDSDVQISLDYVTVSGVVRAYAMHNHSLAFPVVQDEKDNLTTTNKTTKFITRASRYGLIKSDELKANDDQAFRIKNIDTSLLSQSCVILANDNKSSEEGFFERQLMPTACSLFANNGAFPTVTDTLNITPYPLTGSEARRGFDNTKGINFYYQDAAENIFTDDTTDVIQAKKRIRAALYIKNVAFYEFSIVSTDHDLYNNIYFYFETKDTRDFKVRKVENGKTKFETKTEDVNKFCYYFGEKPTGLDPETIFTSINIPQGLTKQEISKLIETAVNTSFQTKFYNLQNSILKSTGVSDFDTKNQNSNYLPQDFEQIACSNFRNQGYQYSKNKIESFDFVAYLAGGTTGTSFTISRYNIQTSNLIPYNTSLVNFHIKI